MEDLVKLYLQYALPTWSVPILLYKCCNFCKNNYCSIIVCMYLCVDAAICQQLPAS